MGCPTPPPARHCPGNAGCPALPARVVGKQGFPVACLRTTPASAGRILANDDLLAFGQAGADLDAIASAQTGLHNPLL